MATKWNLVKEDYLARNLTVRNGPAASLRDVALAWKLPYKTVRNHAAAERWRDELRARTLEQATELASQIKAQNLADETALRLRHAETARQAIHKGLERLNSLNAQDLSPREAIELLRLGLSEERKALGYGERSDLGTPAASADPAIDQQQARHRRMEVLGAALLRFVEEQEYEG